MTPADKEQCIRETIDGFYENERRRVLATGSGRTNRTFYVSLPHDREFCTDAEARDIMAAIRAEFPDLKIEGTRKPADEIAKQARIAANQRRLIHEQKLRSQGG